MSAECSRDATICSRARGSAVGGGAGCRVHPMVLGSDFSPKPAVPSIPSGPANWYQTSNIQAQFYEL